MSRVAEPKPNCKTKEKIRRKNLEAWISKYLTKSSDENAIQLVKFASKKYSNVFQKTVYSNSSCFQPLFYILQCFILTRSPLRLSLTESEFGNASSRVVSTGFNYDFSINLEAWVLKYLANSSDENAIQTVKFADKKYSDVSQTTVYSVLSRFPPLFLSLSILSWLEALLSWVWVQICKCELACCFNWF